MRLLRSVGLVGSIIGVAVAITGAAAAERVRHPVPVATGAVDIRPTGTIVLTAGQGTLIRLSHAAATVFVANPDIADVQVKAPALIYVSAKATGTTVLYAVDKADRVLLSETIKVDYDLTQLRQSFAQLLPGDRIQAETIEGKLVLSGIVATAADAQKALHLAQAIVGEAGGMPAAASGAGGQQAAAAAPTGGTAASSGSASPSTGGTASGKSSKIINQLVVATPDQINLRVRIAEVKKDVLKQLGINWSKCQVLPSAISSTGVKTIAASPYPGTPAGVSGCTGPQPLLGFQTGNPTTGLGDVVGTGVQNAISLGRFESTSGTSVTATLDALAQEGLATTLAEPNLTALSGQTASFLVGGTIEIPTSISVTGGVPTIAVAPEPFGVRLDFTPTVIDANHISLKLRPEVSSLNFANSTSIGNGITVPGKDETVAETTVELGSGQSFALAGLLQRTTTQQLSKVPGIGDVPILGALFRSTQFQHNETELVIIVTPYLVRPVATALQTPVDGFTAPHDAEQVLGGETYRQKLPLPPRGPLGAGGSGLIGPVGFRLD